MLPATDGAQRSSDASKVDAKQHDDRSKTARNIRWGMEDIFILIEAKKAVESQIHRGGRGSSSALATDQTKHKWDLISSYCRQRGVERGPVQCRKRWGNMLCDFRKIRAWESTNREADSFWTMRSEMRKERKLPGVFHREVYDAIGAEEDFPLEAVPVSFIPADMNIDEDHVVEQEEEGDENDETHESGPCTSPEDEYLVDPEQSGQNEINTSTEKEDVETGYPIKVQVLYSPTSDIRRKESPMYKTRRSSTCNDGCKKRRLSSSQGEDISDTSRLIKVLERNNNMLHAQLEAQNQNIERDRKQMKEFNDSLIGILNKLTDAVTKIANKF